MKHRNIEILKLLFSLTIFLILNGHTVAQKLGYKEFQVGKKINAPEFNEYEIGEMKYDSSIHGIFPDSIMNFCDIPIKLIILHTDGAKIIDETQVLTNEIMFQNYKIFMNKFFEIVDCMVSVFGKADSMDLDNKERKKKFVWRLKDVNVILSLTTDDMSTFAENQKRNFIISWQYIKKPKLW